MVMAIIATIIKSIESTTLSWRTELVSGYIGIYRKSL